MSDLFRPHKGKVHGELPEGCPEEEYPDILNPGDLDLTLYGPSLDFSDVGDGHRHAASIAWLAESGITAGYEDGTFRPGAALTRQAMAAFLHRQSEG